MRPSLLVCSSTHSSFADIPTSHMEPKRLLPLKIFDKTTDEHKVNNRNNGGGEERGDAGDAGDVVMQPGARRSRSGTFYEAPSRQKGVILSGGNFHGEYPAKSLDYLTIGTSLHVELPIFASM